MISVKFSFEDQVCQPVNKARLGTVKSWGFYGLAVMMGFSSTTFAVDRVWVGTAGDNSWVTPTNWNPNPATVPGSSDIVFFNGSINTTTLMNGDKSVLGLDFSGTANHTVNSGSGGALGVGSSGIKVLGAQTVTLAPWVRPTMTGSMTILNNGTLRISDNFQTTVQQTVTFDGTGDTSVKYFSRRRSDYDMDIVKNGSGTLTVTGSTLDVATSAVGGFITGNVTVNNGLLLATNTTGSATGAGNVTVNTNGKIGGTGSITGGDAKSITLNSGTLLVGNTHGAGGTRQLLQLGATATNVGLNLNGTLQFDLLGAGQTALISNSVFNTQGNNDLLKLTTTGALNLDNARISLASANTTGWGEGQSWKLMDWTGSALNGNPLTVQLSTTSIGSYFLTQNIITSGAGAGYYITASLVPEPSRMLLFLCGATFCLLRRRVC